MNPDVTIARFTPIARACRRRHDRVPFNDQLIPVCSIVAAATRSIVPLLGERAPRIPRGIEDRDRPLLSLDRHSPRQLDRQRWAMPNTCRAIRDWPGRPVQWSRQPDSRTAGQDDRSRGRRLTSAD